MTLSDANMNLLVEFDIKLFSYPRLQRFYANIILKCAPKVIKSRNFCKISPGQQNRNYSSNRDYKMHNIFENIHHVITSKYTLKYTQLNNIFKIFSNEHTPSEIAIQLHNVTHHTPNQAGCSTMPPHYLKNYTPHV